LDHSLSSTVKISGYFSRILTLNPNSNGIAGPISQPSPTDNKSSTTRINYDQTLKPTLLLHLGVGYLYTYVPSDAPHFDQTSLGLKGYPNPTYFPNISGLQDFLGNGGVNLSSGPFGGLQVRVVLAQPRMGTRPGSSGSGLAPERLILRHPRPRHRCRCRCRCRGRACGYSCVDRFQHAHIGLDNLLGCVEYNANRQLVLNEIHFIPSTSGVQFLEFYLRRTATSSLDIGGYTLWIDGALRHELGNGALTGAEIGDHHRGHQF